MNNYSGYAELLLCVASLVLLLALMLVRRFERGHFTPVSAWLLAWLVLFVMSVIFGGEYNYSASGVFVLVLLVLIFSLGGLTAIGFKSIKKLDGTARVLKIKIPLYLEFAGVFGGLFGAYQLRQGFSSAGYGADDVLSSAASNAAALYSGDYALPMTANLGYSVLLMAAFFSSVRLVFARSKRLPFVLLVTVVLTSLLWTFTTTTRIYFGMVLLWAVSGYLAARVMKQQPVNLLKRKVVTKSLLVVVPFFGLIVFVQSIRLNYGDVGAASEAFDHMRPWLGGTVSAFCVWFEGANDDGYGFGSYLFRAIVKLLGFESQDRFEMLAIGAGEYSNATTMIRGTIQDFGVIGSILFLFVLGFWSVKAYLAAVRGSLVATVWLSLFFTISFFAPNNWVLLYGSRIYAFVITCVVAFFLTWRGRFAGGFNSVRHRVL